MIKLQWLNISSYVLGLIMMIPYAITLNVYFEAVARQPELIDTFTNTLNATKIFAIIGFAILGTVLILNLVFCKKQS